MWTHKYAQFKTLLYWQFNFLAFCFSGSVFKGLVAGEWELPHPTLPVMYVSLVFCFEIGKRLVNKFLWSLHYAKRK